MSGKYDGAFDGFMDSAKDFYNDNKEEVQEWLEEAKEALAKFFADVGRRISKDMLKSALQYAKNAGKMLSPSQMKLAMGYREICEPALDFEQTVRIVKSQYTALKPGDKVAVLIGKEDDGLFKLSMMAVSQDNQVCIGTSGKPYVEVRTPMISSDLKSAFGDKDMLVLQ